MTVQEVMDQLESWGDPQTKKILSKHGAREPFFGVKVANLKKIVKKVKKNHELAIDLYDTGNSDAMYLAGLISDETKISKEDLQRWAEQAYWSYLSEYAVAWTAAESPYAEELADKWIQSEKENIASAGWATWANIVVLKPDDELNLSRIEELLTLAEENIHERKDRVSYAKNGFIIAVGGSVQALTQKAREAGERIGKVTVNMGETKCKVPYIPEYIKKMEARGKIGHKKKTVKC